MCIRQVLPSNKNLRTAVACLMAGVYFHAHGSWVSCGLADLGWAWLAQAELQVWFRSAPRVFIVGSRLKGNS